MFEVQVSDLHSAPENDMDTQQQITNDEAKAIEYVRDIKGFYSHLI